MGNELIQKKTDAISVIENHELGDILKPLISEIYLFDSFIAGTTHLEDTSVVGQVQVGDSLVLRREDNKYDENAILILNVDDKKLGYVPEKDNLVFARLMDAGKILKAKVTDIEQIGTFTKIGVGIYLVDL